MMFTIHSILYIICIIPLIGILELFMITILNKCLILFIKCVFHLAVFLIIRGCFRKSIRKKQSFFLKTDKVLKNNLFFLLFLSFLVIDIVFFCLMLVFIDISIEFLTNFIFFINLLVVDIIEISFSLRYSAISLRIKVI